MENIKSFSHVNLSTTLKETIGNSAHLILLIYPVFKSSQRAGDIVHWHIYIGYIGYIGSNDLRSNNLGSKDKGKDDPGSKATRSKNATKGKNEEQNILCIISGLGQDKKPSAVVTCSNVHTKK